MKGMYKEECNITSCQKPNSAVWFNHSTRAFYCKSCAMRLNADPYNHKDAMRLFGHDLCTLAEFEPKITYLGEELNPNEEHELILDNEFGFKVDITYTDESWYSEKKDTAYNCTEVHWRYNQNREFETDKDVAFESNIHRTGFTRKIHNIKSIVIEKATQLYENY